MISSEDKANLIFQLCYDYFVVKVGVEDGRSDAWDDVLQCRIANVINDKKDCLTVPHELLAKAKRKVK
jgi:hypothetical protein